MLMKGCLLVKTVTKENTMRFQDHRIKADFTCNSPILLCFWQPLETLVPRISFSCHELKLYMLGAGARESMTKSAWNVLLMLLKSLGKH
jgi:hypothetical protein